MSKKLLPCCNGKSRLRLYSDLVVCDVLLHNLNCGRGHFVARHHVDRQRRAVDPRRVEGGLEILLFGVRIVSDRTPKSTGNEGIDRTRASESCSDEQLRPAVAQACQPRRITGSEPQGRDTSHGAQIPVAFTDPANTDFAFRDHEPVIGERRIAQAGQDRIRNGAIDFTNVTIFIDRNGDAERVIIQVVLPATSGGVVRHPAFCLDVPSFSLARRSGAAVFFDCRIRLAGIHDVGTGTQRKLSDQRKQRDQHGSDYVHAHVRIITWL